MGLYQKNTHVCHSRASAETRAEVDSVDGEDQLNAIQFQLADFLGYHANVWDRDATKRDVATANMLMTLWLSPF